MLSRKERLQAELEQWREALCEISSVHSYDRIRKKIAAIQDQLLKFYGIRA